MLTVEALDILALRPGATPSEIKEAYRDLVKVWHPDRFGNDVRLRQKAERQLKLINEAYRILQSNSDAGGVDASGSESGFSSSPGNTSPFAGAYERRSPIPRNGRGRSNSARWIYPGVGIAVIFLGGYLFIEYVTTQGTGSTGGSAAEQSAGIPGQKTLEASAGGRSTDSNGAAIRLRGVGHSKEPGLRQFQVRSLSEAETDRLEMLCSRQRQLSGQAAYQSCLKAQMEVITNPAGKPDLTALREAERESIESVCSEAKRLRGWDGYNRCATKQVASLAAEPARPDVSTLNDVDRHSIESACTNPKNREGPAAYNRCLDRMMRTLAEEQ